MSNYKAFRCNIVDNIMDGFVWTFEGDIEIQTNQHHEVVRYSGCDFNKVEQLMQSIKHITDPFGFVESIKLR